MRTWLWATAPAGRSPTSGGEASLACRRAVGEEPGKLAADGTRYGVTLLERVITAS
ncbi:hypothetical protein PV371_02240 [Streptomyces sp. TX20-6-3]|uniref:hypothetical protein n=1 Tax=Streptomyces sp. TX20-6-3 TaxID=3028705 RepID=UPI0029A6B75F|nr:hypothetical protein [Streptomyces sp. TX20-6-3]MDX2558473.1 hypothetical protein [Streptomyces sp. TX20-6-3]